MASQNREHCKTHGLCSFRLQPPETCVQVDYVRFLARDTDIKTGNPFCCYESRPCFQRNSVLFSSKSPQHAEMVPNFSAKSAEIGRKWPSIFSGQESQKWSNFRTFPHFWRKLVRGSWLSLIHSRPIVTLRYCLWLCKFVRWSRPVSDVTVLT